MKKVLILVLSLCLLCTLAACKPKTPALPEDTPDVTAAPGTDVTPAPTHEPGTEGEVVTDGPASPTEAPAAVTPTPDPAMPVMPTFPGGEIELPIDYF